MEPDTPSQAPMTLAEARAQFPLAVTSTYLDVASRAPMSERVAAALRGYMDVCITRPLPKQEWLDEVERIRARVARLVGARPEEIAFTKSTADSLSVVAHALGPGTGDNVVVCPEIEHTNNLYPWLHLRDQGVEVRMIDAVGHAFPLEHASEAIDARTRIVAVSSTSFVTGARVDLAALAERCHEAGAFLLVDGVQELGALRMDLPALGVDALGAASQKMLLGSYGLGILFCRREHAEGMRPPFLTRMGVEWRDGHEADIDTDPRLRAGAPRFEVGNPNFAGLFALDAALSILEDVGPDVVEAHVLRLARRLIEGATELGLEVVTPAGAHAGLVVLRHPDPHGLEARLAAERITVAVRRGGVRASVHVYNDDADVDHLLGALGDDPGRAG